MPDMCSLKRDSGRLSRSAMNLIGDEVEILGAERCLGQIPREAVR